MKQLDRYIVGSVAGGMLVVMAIVLSLDFVFAFVAETEDFENNYGFFEAISFVFTTIPRRIYDYLPLGAFMGCLIGLGVLSKNSELVVLRAAGVSLGRIVFSALKPAFFVVLIAGLLGEYVVPFTEKIAQSRKAVAQGSGNQVSSSAGLWHREGDEFVNVRVVEPNGRLHGVTIQRYGDSGKLTDIVIAKRAIYQREEWQLEDVRNISLGGASIYQDFKSYQVWDTELSPLILNLLVVKPDNLSLQGLYDYSTYLEEQGLNSAQYRLSFWKKMLQPFATIVLVVVAISFVFGPLRSATMGFRVFCGLVVGLLFKYAQDLLGPSSLVFGFNPIFATIVPIIVCLIFGLVLLRRAG